jgi:hypothetical protein
MSRCRTIILVQSGVWEEGIQNGAINFSMGSLIILYKQKFGLREVE